MKSIRNITFVLKYDFVLIPTVAADLFNHKDYWINVMLESFNKYEDEYNVHQRMSPLSSEKERKSKVKKFHMNIHSQSRK